MGLDTKIIDSSDEEVVRVNWVRAGFEHSLAKSYGLDEPVCGPSVGLLLDEDEHLSCYASRPAH